MSGPSKPPESFGSPKSREQVTRWLACEPVGQKVPGNPNLRQLHRDPQRLVYVAILEQTKLKKHDPTKRNSQGPK